jgi:hypothetical protein
MVFREWVSICEHCSQFYVPYLSLEVVAPMFLWAGWRILVIEGRFVLEKRKDDRNTLRNRILFL